MHSSVSLGYLYTRRTKGRRSLTPMRGKKRHHLKTRSWKKVERPNVQLLQQANAHHTEARDEAFENKHCHHSQWQGGEDRAPKRRWKDTEKHPWAIQEGDCADPEKSVYPGTVCQMRDLSERTDASTETDAETQIEAEEIPS